MRSHDQTKTQSRDLGLSLGAGDCSAPMPARVPKRGRAIDAINFRALSGVRAFITDTRGGLLSHPRQAGGDALVLPAPSGRPAFTLDRERGFTAAAPNIHRKSLKRIRQDLLEQFHLSASVTAGSDARNLTRGRLHDVPQFRASGASDDC